MLPDILRQVHIYGVLLSQQRIINHVNFVSIFIVYIFLQELFIKSLSNGNTYRDYFIRLWQTNNTKF